jgi:hypothetical protein
MSIFEAFKNPVEGYPYEIPVPDEIDDEWWTMFMQAYAGNGSRAKIHTYNYFHSPAGQNRFDFWALPKYMEDSGALFDGEIVGIKILFVDDWEDKLYKMPYLVLRDVKDINAGWGPTDSPYDSVMVPLTTVTGAFTVY